MSLIDGGEVAARALKKEGIDTAFVLCGGHIMPLLYGMRNQGIEIIDVRHECSAVFAGLAYARACGKMAAVVTTAGPGIAHTPAGMMEAQALGMPLIHIGGAVDMNLRDAGDLQDMDTLGVMQACSRWARKVTSIHRIPEYATMSIRQAMDITNPGPVYLEIPTNILFEKIEETSVRYPEKSRTTAIPWGDTTLIEQAADLLVEAKKPAMLVDDGARFSVGRYANSVAALADYLKMPIGVRGSACRGLFGDEYEHPLYRIDAAHAADVVLALGCRFDFRWQFGRYIAEHAKVIQVHTDPTQIGFNLRVDMGIVGGAGPVAAQLLDTVKRRMSKPRDASWCLHPPKGGTSFLWDEYRSNNVPIHPARCAGEVARFLEEEARDYNIVIDGGEAGVWMGLAACASRLGQIQGGSANGTLGVGAGFVIGSWAANRKPALWYTGDGTFGFYAMELDTMARFGVPVICVISNDSAWGMIRLTERYIRADEIKKRGQCHTELHHMRAYEKIAEVCGGYGEMVTQPDEIIPALRRAATAAAEGKPSIVNVEVDQVGMSPFITGFAKMIASSE